MPLYSIALQIFCASLKVILSPTGEDHQWKQRWKSSEGRSLRYCGNLQKSWYEGCIRYRYSRTDKQRSFFFKKIRTRPKAGSIKPIRSLLIQHEEILWSVSALSFSQHPKLHIRSERKRKIGSLVCSLADYAPVQQLRNQTSFTYFLEKSRAAGKLEVKTFNCRSSWIDGLLCTKADIWIPAVNRKRT